MPMRPAILIVDASPRGIDLGASSEIDRPRCLLSDDGASNLTIPSDTEKTIGGGDRVAVLHEGRIAGRLEQDGLSAAAILSLAVGRLAA
jgi:ribose transport system ATP-binding protein